MVEAAATSAVVEAAVSTAASLLMENDSIDYEDGAMIGLIRSWIIFEGTNYLVPSSWIYEIS